MNYLKYFLTLAAIIAALGVVGNADFEEASRQEAQYCEFVADGTWPPYNSSIDCRSYNEN